METVIDLKDLLKHEIMDLYSAEEQIIEALPLMIEKAGNDKLKAALRYHLKVTKDQKTRLDEIKQLLGEEAPGADTGGDEKPGFFSRLFGSGEEKCKGMEGLITEGKKMMSSDMSPEASDAAIIASAQKIEHYEISGYGTARAFARELNLGEVAHKLEQTLNEEYAADDLLTKLAVGKINVEAEFADGSMNGHGTAKRSGARSNGKSNVKVSTVKKTKSNATNGKATAAKSNSSKTVAKPTASKKSSSPGKQSSSKAGSTKSAIKSKAASKKSPAKSSKSASNKSASKVKSRRRL